MISVKDVKKRYKVGEKDFWALNGVSLDIADGEFVAITGKSGSGKSTLLNIIGTLDNVTSGVVSVEGKDVSQFDRKQIATFRNKTVGFVFQSFYLEPNFTVYANVELPLILAGKVGNNRKTVEHVLSLVGLSDKIDEKARGLSGGEQQRVAIARAIVNNPTYLLADEPCGNLDTANGNKIMEIFTALNKQGKTIIMVTHDADDAAKAKRIVTMSDGQILNDENVFQTNRA